MARPFVLLDYTAAGVSAVAADFPYILILRISAVIAAIFLFTPYRANTSGVSTLVVVVSHKLSP